MVELYAFEIIIDGLKYEGHIPAKSWNEAESLAKQIGGKINGKLYISKRKKSAVPN